MAEVQGYVEAAPCAICGRETKYRDRVAGSDGWAPICSEGCSQRFIERRQIALWLRSKSEDRWDNDAWAKAADRIERGEHRPLVQGSEEP